MSSIEDQINFSYIFTNNRLFIHAAEMTGLLAYGQLEGLAEIIAIFEGYALDE